jgi:hypothetical protein
MNNTLSKQHIDSIVRQIIETDENIGRSTGGSGHSSFISYSLDKLDIQNSDDTIHIEFVYTMCVETEFTYYPDNPPQCYTYKKGIVITKKGEIISESKKKIVNGTGNNSEMEKMPGDY